MGKLGDDIVRDIQRLSEGLPPEGEEGIRLRMNLLERLTAIARRVTRGGNSLSSLTAGAVRLDASGLSTLPLRRIRINDEGLVAVDSDGTTQVKIDATTGQLLAGGEDVIIDENGIKIIGGTDNWNLIRWMNGDDLIAYLRGAQVASFNQADLVAIGYGASYKWARVRIAAEPTAGGGGGATSEILLETTATALGDGWVRFRLGNTDGGFDFGDTAGNHTLIQGKMGDAVRINSQYSDIDTIISGDTDVALVHCDAGNDAVTIGGTAEIGKLGVDGNADEIQLAVQGHSTQTNNLQEWQSSAAAVLAKITPTGGALFGDKVMFTQTDGNEYIDSLADGYMDYRATTAHRFGDGTNATEISNTGDITFTGTGGLRYGSLYYHGAGSSIVVALQDTWYQFVGFDTNGESNGMTPVKGEDHILVSKAGDYQISLNLATRCVSTTDWEISVWVNNGATQKIPVDIHVTTIAGLKAVHASVTDIVNLAANDTIEMWVQRTDGGGVSKTLTFDHASISAVMVGGGA